MNVWKNLFYELLEDLDLIESYDAVSLGRKYNTLAERAELLNG